ncbi:hypothetical protein GCM10010440_42320 [Kitasatospora cinereorecta]
MAVELPSELQFVLNLLGIHWPQANEDELNKLADQLKKLASAIDSTQMAGDKALKTLGEVYHGDAADKLAEMWSGYAKYSGIVVEACETAAKVLNAAAVVIEVCKGQTIVQLVNIQAQLAASSATFGISTAAVIAMGREIISKILDAAVGQLGQMIARPIADLVDSAVKQVTGTAPASSSGQGFGLDMAAMAACAAELRRHGDDIDAHGNSFRRIVDSLDVGNPSDMFGKIAVEAAKQIAQAVGQEILNRLLGNYRGTADKMDTVLHRLGDQEDSHLREMNAIGSHTASPLSPLKLAGGVAATAAAGHGDPGLSAFDSLRPHLPGGGGIGGTGGHGGLDGAGFGSKLGVLGGVHAGQAGAGGHGGGPDLGSGGDHTAASGQQLRLGVTPGSFAGGSGGGSRGNRIPAQTDLSEAGGGSHSGSTAGSNGVVGATGSGTRQASAPPPGMMGGMMGGAHYGGGGHGGGSGGGQVRAAAGAQRGRRRDEDDEEKRSDAPVGENPEDQDGDPGDHLRNLGHFQPTHTEEYLAD